MKITPTLLSFAAFAACASLSQGALVSRYTFDASNGNDSAGSNNLTSTGTITYVTAGVPAGLGQAAQITNNPDSNAGAASYFSLTSGLAAGNYSLSNFSISLWFSETTSMTNRFNSIFAISGAGGAQTNLDFLTFSTGGTARASLNNEAINSAANTAWLSGTWHNAVFVGGANSLSYYLDGDLVGTVAVTPTGTLAELFLFRGGAHNSGSLRGWNGQIADVQLYDQNLTAQEVSFLNANAGQAIPEPSVALLGGLSALGLLARRRR